MNQNIENILNDDVVQLRMKEHNLSTGELHISLIWNDICDLDLHVVVPSGEELYYGHRESRCGGWLDKDMNAGGEASLDPIENVFFASAPNGKYKVFVHNYNCKCDQSAHFSDSQRSVPYRVKMVRNGNVEWFSGSVKNHQKETCWEFNYKDGSGSLGSFIVLSGLAEKSTFKNHCDHFKVTYNKGEGYYGLRRREKISTKKDVLLHNMTDDTFLIGRVEVFEKLRLDENEDHFVKVKDIPENHTLYVQSTSHNRVIPPNTKVLMRVGVREALKFRQPDRYNHL